MTNYASGANFERRVKADLEERGHKLVVRAAGSHGPVDLIVPRFMVTAGMITMGKVVDAPEWPYLIQCKTRKPTTLERAKLMTVSRYGICIMAWRDGRKIVYEELRLTDPPHWMRIYPCP